MKFKLSKTSSATKVRSSRSIKDFRLWIGLIFILISIFLSQTIVAKATARSQIIVMVNEVPAGSEITENDLTVEEAVLPDSVKSVAAKNKVIGMIALRDLKAGDILTSESVSNRIRTELRMVSVPIKAGHLPNLESGQLVDVWVTPSTDGMALPGPAQLVINEATISAVPGLIDPAMDTAVTLLINQSNVAALVQALRDGVIDLVALPDNQRSVS